MGVENPVVQSDGILPAIILRSFKPGDDAIVTEILNGAFRGLEFLPRAKAALSSPYFNREASLLAEEDGSPKGLTAVFNLPAATGSKSDLLRLEMPCAEGRSRRNLRRK